MSNYRLLPTSSDRRRGHVSDHDGAARDEEGLSRRAFLQASAGGLAVGTLAGSGLAGTALAEDFDRGHRRAPRGRRVLIKGGVVLTMDPGVGDFEQADVLIDGSKIVKVGPNIRAAAQVVDARGMIVMPGFVDTHHHQYETIQRANNADGNLQWAGANPVWPQEGYGTVVQSIWTTGRIQIGNDVIWDLGRSADSSRHCNSSSERRSVGLANSRRLRGRWLSWSATASSSASVTVEKSKPFGKYCRRRPLVFSLDPRCQGACGSQKNTSTPAARCTCFQSRISGPWSQVSERRNASGSVCTLRASAGATCSGL